MKLNSLKTLLNMTTINNDQNTFQMKEKVLYIYSNHFYCSRHLSLNRISEKNISTTIIKTNLNQ